MPPREFSEPDWKVFRRLRTVALDRFCQRVLDETVRTCADDSRSHHERFLAMYHLIQKRNRELADAFDTPRRSAALEQILLFRRHQILTDAEFAEFSPAVHQFVSYYLDEQDDEIAGGGDET